MTTKPKKCVYVAGPMRGIPAFNYPAFNAAAAKLRALGCRVVNPVEVGEDFGTVEELAANPALLERAMRRELALLAECDAIHLLPGWEKSVGARRELALAIFLGLEITCAPVNR